jgi:hypothetical protein
VPRSPKPFRPLSLTSVLLALALALLAAHYFPLQRVLPAKTSRAPLFQAKATNQAASTPFGHPYYRYSVIPGGAHTTEELKAALAKDPLVASHYSDFRLEKTRVVTLETDRVCYVSYRIGDKLFWTRRPVTLNKGEKLLTDGVHYARTRCGNRISDTPPAQAASVLTEPEERVLNAPVPVQTTWAPKVSELEAAPHFPFELAYSQGPEFPEPLANLLKPLVPDAPIERDYVPTPNEHEKPPIFARDGSLDASVLPIFFPSETPPASVVPEPGTAALGGLALIAVALLARYMRKRA